MNNRLNLPFELQRKAELGRAISLGIINSLAELYEQRFRNAFDIKILLIVTKLRRVIFEAIQRIDEQISKDIQAKETEELNKPIVLPPDLKETINQFKEVLPEIKRMMQTAKGEFGFSDEDIKMVEEYINFINKLYELKYIEGGK